MALFVGAKLSDDTKVAFLVPLSAMVLSGLTIGFRNTIIAVYLSFIFLGFWGTTLAKKEGMKSVALTSKVSSALFYNQLCCLARRKFVSPKFGRAVDLLHDGLTIFYQYLGRR